MARIVLLTGPSGAGKSTVSKEFIKSASEVWAYISQDDIRQLVKAGYASADDYEKNWSDETRRQWNVSIPICTAIAREYQAVGINCLIDCFAPQSELEAWDSAFGKLNYEVVVLLPSETTTVQRNAARSHPAKLKTRKIIANHELFQNVRPGNATIIDSTKLSVAETVQALQSFLAV